MQVTPNEEVVPSAPEETAPAPPPPPLASPSPAPKAKKSKKRKVEEEEDELTLEILRKKLFNENLRTELLQIKIQRKLKQLKSMN